MRKQSLLSTVIHLYWIFLITVSLSISQIFVVSEISHTHAEENTTPQISCGEQCSLLLKPDGTVWAWGFDGYGQLGDTSLSDKKNPIKIKGLKNVIAIAGGGYHCLALERDGTVSAWGDNANGQLGDDTLTEKDLPIKTKGITNVISLSCGEEHSLCLTSDGTVWAWGDNGSGELGDGTTENRHIPTLVKNLHDVVAIACGGEHSLALKSDGTVWAWGDDYKGQIGKKAHTFKNTIARKVKGIENVIDIAGGEMHSLALKSDGTVWAWGDNEYGQLGKDQAVEMSKVPVPVKGLSHIVDIACGQAHCLAIKSDGTVWAWGNDDYGQLGNGITKNMSIKPVQVKRLDNIISIDGGWRHSLALSADGTVWAWGLNWHGELGDGTKKDSKIPVKSNISIKKLQNID